MRIPKPLETLFALYPAFHGGLIAVTLVWFVRTLDFAALASFVAVSYLLSPFLWTLVKALFGPKTEGAFYIGKRAEYGNIWLLSYHLQSVYAHFSFFERTLKLAPGAYSAWLRLWGSSIGRKVNWTPGCQIVDRGHLEIGDRAFIGNRSYLSAHILKKRNARYFLFVKRIRIGADTMVSYAANIGPGVVIGARAHLDPGAELYPNMIVADGETVEYDRIARA